jgi:hypothetical protein
VHLLRRYAGSAAAWIGEVADADIGLRWIAEGREPELTEHAQDGTANRDAPGLKSAPRTEQGSVV